MIQSFPLSFEDFPNENWLSVAEIDSEEFAKVLLEYHSIPEPTIPTVKSKGKKYQKASNKNSNQTITIQESDIDWLLSDVQAKLKTKLTPENTYEADRKDLKKLENL